jgi:methylmalonyl-CoA/ethylmalonyl-CoA epimerase
MTQTLPPLSLHHVGIAVPDIATATALYTQRFGYTIASPVIHDPTQTAYVQFLRLPNETSFLEFVAPDSPTSKLSSVVARGGGLNHLCYSVTDIHATIEGLRSSGMVTLCEPVAAVAFPGRKIAWLLGTDRVPVELVEAGEPGQL